MLEFVDTLEHNGQTYQAFFPAETEGENEDDPDNGLVILKVIHEEEYSPHWTATRRSGHGSMVRLSERLFGRRSFP